MSKLLLLGLLLLGACGSGSPHPSALSAEGWVQRGMEQFRAAQQVTVAPEADGEAACGELAVDVPGRPAVALPSCSSFVLTQHSSTWNEPSICDSIPTCATDFFGGVQPKTYQFVPETSVDIEVNGSNPNCGGWCVWQMDFNRSTGDISRIDAHLAGGTHVGWPVWYFSDYVVNGAVRDPRTGTFSVTLTGDFKLAARGLGTCKAPGFIFNTPQSFGNEPTLVILDIVLSGNGSEVMMTADVRPGLGSRLTYVYSGKVQAPPIAGDVWHRSFKGSLPRQSQAGSEMVSGSFNCG